MRLLISTLWFASLGGGGPMGAVGRSEFCEVDAISFDSIDINEKWRIAARWMELKGE